MNKHPVIQKLEKTQMKNNLEDFRVGDSIRVHTRVIEGGKRKDSDF